MNKADFRSLKLINKKKKRQNKKRVFFVIASVIVLVFFVYLLNRPVIQIENIKISGGKFVNKAEIENLVKDEFSKKYLFIIKKSNYFIFPKYSLEKKISELNPAIKSIKISRNSFKEIEIQIEESFPVAVTCQNETKTDCFLINENGLIIAKGPLIIEENAIEITNFFPELKIGQKYFDEGLFKKVVQFVNLLRENNFHPDLIQTDDNTTFKVHISEGPQLYYEKHDDPKEVLINLLTVMEKDSININQFQNIEYIDLRFGNKVYYKIK